MEHRTLDRMMSAAKLGVGPMIRRSVRRTTVVLAVAALAAAACSSNGPAKQNDTGPIVIGASLPLTGGSAEPGVAAQRGYQIWLDMVNASGGILGRSVEMVIRDDASSQSTIVSDYNFLISQKKVDLLLGTFSSELNLPASTVAERNKMVYVEPAGGSPELFNRGYRFLFFAQPAASVQQGDLFAQWVTSLPAEQRPKTAAYPSMDDPFTAPVIEGLRTKLEAAGITTVYQALYPPDTTNFDSIAASIGAKKPDLIAQGSIFEDGVGLIRSLQKVGYSPKMMLQTTAPSLASQYSDGVGLANTEGIFYPVSWSPAATYPQNQEFVKAFQTKFGEDPPEDAANAFTAGQVLQAAVEAVGTIDQQKIADWLRANTVDTIVGPLSWDGTGAPQGAFILAQWQDGVSQVVLPKEVATSDKIVILKPPWQG